MTTANYQIILSSSVKKTISKIQYYSEQSFVNDANNYISAIKKGSMLCIINSVSKSGLSRTLKFNSFTQNAERYNYRQYTNLFKALGCKEKGNTGEFIVDGCEMNLIFNLNYAILHGFKSMGIITQEECNVLVHKIPTSL